MNLLRSTFFQQMPIPDLAATTYAGKLTVPSASRSTGTTDITAPIGRGP
jgi:hypothetical protein